MFARTTVTYIPNRKLWAVTRHLPGIGWIVLHYVRRLDDAILGCAVSNLNLPAPDPTTITIHRFISMRDELIWSPMVRWIRHERHDKWIEHLRELKLISQKGVLIGDNNWLKLRADYPPNL